jgi:hypothetical protein
MFLKIWIALGVLMQTKAFTLKTLAALSLFLLFTCVAAFGDTSPNVTGTWNISVSGEAGSANQTVVLKQDGDKITGTFKGPRQSGPLEGTVEGNNIKFHVNTRVPLDYTGTVDGDAMKGTMSGRGKTGDWTATRAK